MRGEHLIGQRLLRSLDGSSPHARGTLPSQSSHRTCRRFIPACAGNTYAATSRRVSGTVHPRMRGEHSSCTRPIRQHCGSSPHARGTRAGQHRQPGRVRFIPACAGNTYWLPRYFRESPVHPRMRGEHTTGLSCGCSRAGSSPHARGTRLRLRLSRRR